MTVSGKQGGALIAKLCFLILMMGVTTALFVVQRMFSASWSTVSPQRWLSVTFTPLFICYYAVLRSSLDIYGAFVALFMGAILTLANLAFLFDLLFFFLSSSKITRFRESDKRQLEGSAFKEGGGRNWIQVLCNGGMATQLALLYLLDVGSFDLPLDFERNYRATWLSISLMSSLACCNGDTWASEIGSVWNRNAKPRLITNFQEVPRGTNGAVSPMGLFVSLLGGAVVGFGHWLAIALFADPDFFSVAPPQYHVIFIGAIAGLAGSLVDSLLGATLQFSGQKAGSKEIVEEPGAQVRRISGMPILDNHGVNLLSTVITAVLMPTVALKFYY